MTTAAEIQHLQQHGLYSSSNEHDACGLGFVAHIKGIKRHPDIGDHVTIYELPEPAVPDPSDADRASVAPIKPTHAWTVRYPEDKPFDAEAFFVLGTGGYLIAKHRNATEAGLYRFDLDPRQAQQVMRPVLRLPIRVPVTAADVSPDGRWLAVLTVMGPRVFRIDGDAARAAKVAPLAATFVHPNLEAVCFVEDGLIATTERRQVLLFTWEQLRAGAVLTAPQQPPTPDR